jgi:hypothetical protein
MPGEKRCRHYVSGGACARGDEFMCVEWLKANGANPDPDPPPTSNPARDLFGHPVIEPPRPTPTKPSLAKGTPARELRPQTPAVERAPLCGLTPDDIASFKQLGVEVCLSSEAYGELWLVPEYTGRDRRELTPEHAATIGRMLEVFPGSKVVSFTRATPKEKEADA